MKLNKKIKVNNLLNQLPVEYTYEILNSNLNLEITGINNLIDATESEITWISPKKINKNELLNNTKSKIVLINFFPEKNVEKQLIVTDNPRILYIEILNLLFEKRNIGIISTYSFVNEGAKISENVTIGNFTTIGICEIGKNTIIGNNCNIGDNVIIGDNVVIKSNTNIGFDGFGYERKKDKSFLKFPHLGKVIIGNNVDIGSNTCIDKGTLSNTIIGDGTKIDNLVHIAHNVEIGINTAVIANSMIAGGVKIGNNTWIGPSSSILEKVTIGNNSFIGIASLILKDVPSNEVWVGSPGRFLKNNE